MFRKPNRTNPYTFGENDWSDENWHGCNDYFVSKIKAEKAAWEFMENKGLKNKLVCICPGGVFGDALDAKEKTSKKPVLISYNSVVALPNKDYKYFDVQSDVADLDQIMTFFTK